MAAKKVSIAYFLEDVAHEQFIPPLVHRIGRELPDRVSITDHIIHARGGSQSLRYFEQFLRDLHSAAAFQIDAIHCDLIVVCIDGNGIGPAEKRRQLQKMVEQLGAPKDVVYAIPDPYIECWYLCDPQAVKQAISSEASIPAKPAKIDKDSYKTMLEEACLSANIEVAQGGAEFGRDIVEYLDLYAIERREASIKLFFEDLRPALKQCWSALNA